MTMYVVECYEVTKKHVTMEESTVLFKLLGLTFREEVLHGHPFFGLNTTIANIFRPKTRFGPKLSLQVCSLKEYSTFEPREFLVVIFRKEVFHGHPCFGLNTTVANIFRPEIRFRPKHSLLVR